MPTTFFLEPRPYVFSRGKRFGRTQRIYVERQEATSSFSPLSGRLRAGSRRLSRKNALRVSLLGGVRWSGNHQRKSKKFFPDRRTSNALGLFLNTSSNPTSINTVSFCFESWALLCTVTSVRAPYFSRTLAVSYSPQDKAIYRADDLSAFFVSPGGSGKSGTKPCRNRSSVIFA